MKTNAPFSIFKKIKPRKKPIEINVTNLAMQEKERQYQKLLQGKQIKGINGININTKKAIKLNYFTKILGRGVLKNGSKVKITDNHDKKMFNFQKKAEKPVVLKNNFLNSDFFNKLHLLRKNQAMKKDTKKFFNKTFSSSFKIYNKLKFKANQLGNKKLEKYESYKTKEFFFPLVQHMKYRMINDRNMKKMFNKENNSMAHLSTEESIKNSKNKSNNVKDLKDEELIKINIGNENSVANNVNENSRIKPIINKYFNKKPGQQILKKKNIKPLFVELNEEGIYKEIKKIDKKLKKLKKRKIDVSKKSNSYQENIEDYEPNAQLFDKKKYNKNQEKERNKIFITALEKNKYPYDKLSKLIRNNIANDIRKDFVLRGGKDF